jgi:hypothetical protein
MDGFLADHSKRAKRPVNDDSQDNYSQQKGKYQLIGIKPFQNYNPFAPIRNKKVAQSPSCKRSQVLQMCVIRATSYSLLCWSL